MKILEKPWVIISLNRKEATSSALFFVEGRVPRYSLPGKGR